MSPEEMFELLTEENKEIIRQEIEALVASQSSRQPSSC